MYSYPLKFEFPLISLGRQVDVKNGDGGFIMRLVDPFVSFKDSMTIVNGKGNVVYQVNGDSSMRFIFQFASTSSSWTVLTPDGSPVLFFDDYWARMEEFKEVQVTSNANVMRSDGRADIGGVLGNVAANMLNNRVAGSLPSRLVYRVMDKEYGEVKGWVVPSRGTGWFDFLPYDIRIKILNLPFAAKLYAPSYEFKLGSNLYGPTVLKLQKQRDLLFDRYTLEKTGNLGDVDERWVIPAMSMVTMFERQRLKQMTDW